MGRRLPAGARRAEFEAKIGEHAAQSSRLAFVASPRIARARDLRAVERSSEASTRASLALTSSLPLCRRLPRAGVARIGPMRGAVVGRRDVCGRRAARRRSCPRACRLDRAGRDGIGDAAECRRARFERRLAAHQIIELLLELLLIEQLTAGRAIDLRAQFGDTIFVGVLLLGLARDEPFQEIVAESEIGGCRDRPAAMITTVPTKIQNATGPSLIWRPACAKIGNRRR